MNPLKEKLLKHLDELAFFLEYHDDNPFRIRAFKIGSEALSALSDQELSTKIKDGSLTDLKGIGKGIASIAEAFLKTGTSPDWAELKGELPISLIALQPIPGLGVKKIRALYENLQISSVGELEYACSENRLVDLPGFGVKTQNKILQSLKDLKGREGKLILADALNLAAELERSFPRSLTYCRIQSLGRYDEIVSGMDYLVPIPQIATVKKLKGLKNIDSSPDRINVQLQGHRLQFHFCSEESIFIQRILQTASDDHWRSLEKAAEASDLKLNHDFLNKNGKPIKIDAEEDLYKKLGLPFYQAFERELPAHAKKKSQLELKDLTGVFHFHTTASDGNNSLEEMAKAARSFRWKFIGLSDHSKSAYYARGLTEESLEKQWKEVALLNSKFPEMKILRGIESDILKDGALDYSDDVLKKFDFVIASIHSRFGMTEMTERLIKAIENPSTNIVGHLTGRLLLAREGYTLDHSKIIDAAIRNRTAIELNAHPNRLDMDWRYLTRACEKGLIISINPDAHSIAGFGDVQYGIWMARKAGVPNESILNTWPLEKISTFLAAV